MATAAKIEIPVRNLAGQKIPFEILKYIPEESAKYYRFVPLGIKDSILEVGIVDPENMQARDAIAFISSRLNLPFKLYLISESDFNNVLGQYQNLSGEVNKALQELDMELSDSQMPDELMKALSSVPKKEEKQETKLVEEAPITKIVAVIIRHAIDGNASDIHIEPVEGKVRVRFRVDGILHTSLLLPSAVSESIVSRIKIVTNMKLDEKRKPQDGRFTARIEGRQIDFRVSTFPTYFGEKVVLRILDSETGLRKLTELGMSQKHLEVVKRVLQRPYGLVLLTGPTGSGKTTTLYSMLNELDREIYNVISLEDPVEYKMVGVNQSQVRPEISYDFASGLRSILRQDPDIIMVGEIRDKETAQLAIQAALTGHMVFSTLHTNDSIGVIPRLVDMGVDPYLIAPTLVLAVAQRLVRKTCPDSKEAIPIEGSVKMMIDKQFNDMPTAFRSKIQIPANVYKAVPSSTCPAGTKGRIAVFEILEIDRDMEKVILTNPVDTEIYKVARGKGFNTIKEDALLKAFEGIIPFEEVNSL